VTLTEFTKTKTGNNLGVIIPAENGAHPRSSRGLPGGNPPRPRESVARGNGRKIHFTASREVSKMPTVQGTEIAPDQDYGSFVSVQDPLEKCAEHAHQLAVRERAEENPDERSDPRTRILALYDEFRPRLFRYMRSMHLGQDQADEVIQETFMRLTAELLKNNQIENVQGWIVRVAHNLAIDLLKRDQGPVVATESAAFLIGNRVDPSLNPEDAYAVKEQSRRMTTALSTLNPQHRQCFQMRAQGLRYRDIGLALGISEQRAAFVVKQAAVRLAAICG
jgi:RNA polymerase sigma factor (sigma-70 family)